MTHLNKFHHPTRPTSKPQTHKKKKEISRSKSDHNIVMLIWINKTQASLDEI